MPWLQQGAYRPSLRWICERISGHSIAVHADCKLRTPVTPVNGQVSSPCKSTFPVTALIGTLLPRGSKAICLVWQIVSEEPCWVVS